MSNLTEFIVEKAAIAWLESLGCPVVHGLEITLDAQYRVLQLR